MSQVSTFHNNCVNNVLFPLLRNELWGGHFNQEIDNQDLKIVLRISREQTVFGLVFNALQANHIILNRKLAIQAIALQNQIQLQNERINHEMVDFLRQMDERQIDYLVIKGQTIASMYPHPEMRMPGDVDFLIKEDFDIIRDKFKSYYNIQLPSYTKYKKDYAFHRNKVTFEIHSYLITFGSSTNTKYWNELISNCWNQKYIVNVLDTEIRTLPPNLYAIYIFLHLFFHFIREGVGLRQFCDWAVLLNYYYQEIDVAEIEKILTHLDMIKAYKAFGSIVVHELGLPANKFPLEITAKDRKWGVKILQSVMQNGNFGKLNHTAKHTGLIFKLETALVAIRNVLTYFPLAPRDLRNYLPRLIKGNIVLFIKRKNSI